MTDDIEKMMVDAARLVRSNMEIEFREKILGIHGQSTVASEESVNKWKSVSVDDLGKISADFIEKNRELNRKTDMWNERLSRYGLELRNAQPGEEGYTVFPPHFGLYFKRQRRK